MRQDVLQEDLAFESSHNYLIIRFIKKKIIYFNSQPSTYKMYIHAARLMKKGRKSKLHVKKKALKKYTTKRLISYVLLI
jgi:hypothetical protein